jgi:hypothetical protein
MAAVSEVELDSVVSVVNCECWIGTHVIGSSHGEYGKVFERR